ncbi:cysteine-rich protein 1 isoform X4 [Oncorhynchus keta]|uniref:cysteine-rich protein 1 isoform X4 n=1 Tax=Oncorhynchus keta TaxID=8018 RepID=UPI00227B884A|nr:cysteine-rich protein 1 isoform X4 [Oncorhynchus keta]
MVGYCPICGKPVYFGEKKRSLGRDYHPLCLKCQLCQRQLTPGQHAEHDEKPYCTNCYMKTFGPRGNRRMMSNCHSSASSSSFSSKEPV